MGGNRPRGRELFATRARPYGELYDRGECVSHHPDAQVAGHEIAGRLVLRQAAQEAAARHEAEELAARSLAARARSLVVVGPGQRVFFLQGSEEEGGEGRGGFPRVLCRSSDRHRTTWSMHYGARVFLATAEHIRGLTREEEAVETPDMRDALVKLYEALGEKEQEYEDLTGQGNP